MTAVAGTGTAQNDRRGQKRRARAVALRYPERRTGFDRRFSSRYQIALDRFRTDPRAIAGVLGLVLALNALDLVLTVQALDRGATEANPIMAWLFGQGLPIATAFKLGVGLVVTLAIWRLRKYRRMLELSLVLTGVFTLVFAYHLAGLLLAS